MTYWTKQHMTSRIYRSKRCMPMQNYFRINDVFCEWLMENQVRNKKQTNTQTIFLRERGSSPTVIPLLQQRLLNMASAIINLSLVEQILTTSSARTSGDTSAREKRGKRHQIPASENWMDCNIKYKYKFKYVTVNSGIELLVNYVFHSTFYFLVHYGHIQTTWNTKGTCMKVKHFYFDSLPWLVTAKCSARSLRPFSTRFWFSLKCCWHQNSTKTDRRSSRVSAKCSFCTSSLSA